MQSSIQVSQDPTVQYLLRIGDTALILGQRLAEWTGHAPVLEEDIALANMALDLVGQSRAVLTHAGVLEGAGHDEDQLAFLREERDYRNATIVELPRGDFAFTVVRNTMMATFFKLLWERLASSSADEEVAAIAAKAVKEARYHQQHAADWCERLGRGTDESRARMEAALMQLWHYSNELFASDAVDEHAAETGLGPRWGDLKDAWRTQMHAILSEADLAAPAETGFISAAKRGVHSEHMGFLLAELQHLQRAYPGGRVVTRTERAWDVLGGVLDPEVPALSVRDLGIVRDVIDHGDELEIVLTPTYSGCPATEVIEANVLAALEAEGLGPARATLRRAPAWTTDWITEEGKLKLNEYGIAPPGPVMPDGGVPIRILGRKADAIACPRCTSLFTEKLSAFGSTACKAMYRCLSCSEPFEHFKPI